MERNGYPLVLASLEIPKRRFQYIIKLKSYCRLRIITNLCENHVITFDLILPTLARRIFNAGVPESFEKLTSVNKKLRILTVPLAFSFEIIFRNSARISPRTA